MYQILVSKAKQKLHEAQLRRQRFKVNKDSCSCKEAIDLDLPSSNEKLPKSEEKANKDNAKIAKIDSKEIKLESLDSKMDERIEQCEERLSYREKFDVNCEEKLRLGMSRNFSEQNLKTMNSQSCESKCCSKSNPNLIEYSDECSMELIQLDIARTFPHLCIFQPGGPYFDVLHELLAAYVCFRPDIGYIQVGMAFQKKKIPSVKS